MYMTEENKPSPDPSELELGSQEGTEDVSTTETEASADQKNEAGESLTLDEINQLSGPKF